MEAERMLAVYRRFRWAALAGFVIILTAAWPFFVQPYSLLRVYLVASAALAVNLASHALRPSNPRWRGLLGFFILTDLALATAFIHFTGGLDSPFSWIYATVITTATTVAGSAAGFFTGIASVAFYAVDLWAEYSGWLPFYHPRFLSTHLVQEHFVRHTIRASVLANGILFLGTALLVAILHREIEARRRELAQAHESRARLLHQVVTSQEEERKRIAHELHDEIGQTLTVLAMSLGFAERNWSADADRARQTIQGLEDLTNRALEELQRIIYDLRPSLLDDLGLAAAVRSYLGVLEHKLDVKTDFRVSGEERRLPGHVETVLFRAIQEGLTNAIRHGKARHIEISLAVTPDRVDLSLADDGEGFEPSAAEARGRQKTGGLGLTGMRERVSLLGGTLRVRSRPGRGTRLDISVPLRPGSPRKEDRPRE